MAKKMTKSKPGPATQRYLDIAEIRDDMVVLKDGTVRGVYLVSSINFALKSEDEQKAIIQAYMQFLNSIEYPVQIVIQSRKMNIDRYITEMQQQINVQMNELLKTQIREYIAFIQQLVELGEIMTKRFYLVVPYDPVTNKRRNFFVRMGEVLSPAKVLKLSKAKFDERKHELDQRMDILGGALSSMSLAAARLDTQGLIEMYYSVYNPESAEVQKLEDVNKLRMEESGAVGS
ncbi:MAG: TraC family protein [Patescibacteria group bacterium]